MSGLRQRYMNMDGGNKYNDTDIVRGKRTLSNGAIAGYVLPPGKAEGEEVWRIVSGATKGMDRIRAMKGTNKPITRRQAMIAFNKHYKKTKADGETLRRGPGSKKYDLNHTRPTEYLVTDQRYLRSPSKYDFRGVDTGPKQRAARSQAQLDNDERLRNRPFGTR